MNKIVYIGKYIYWAYKIFSKSYNKYKKNVAAGMSEIDALADALPEKQFED